MQDIPQEVSDLGKVAHAHLDEMHRFRMAFIHLVFGLRSHINHFHGALGELDREDMQPTKPAMVGLREDLERLLGKLEILQGIEGLKDLGPEDLSVEDVAKNPIESMDDPRLVSARNWRAPESDPAGGEVLPGSYPGGAQTREAQRNVESFPSNLPKFGRLA